MKNIVKKQAKVISVNKRKTAQVNIQAKQLNPFIGEMVDIYIRKRKEGEE